MAAALVVGLVPGVGLVAPAVAEGEVVAEVQDVPLVYDEEMAIAEVDGAAPVEPVPVVSAFEEFVAEHADDPASEVLSPFARAESSADGTVTVDMSAEASFRPTGDGGWEPIDTSVTEVAGGGAGLEAAGTLLPVEFGATADDLLTLDLAPVGPGGEVTVSAPGLEIAPPVEGDGGVVYDDVAPGASLLYEVTPTAVKESVILDSVSSPRSFTFHVAGGDGVLGEPAWQDDGSLLFPPTDPEGSGLVVPAPFAFEQSVTDDATRMIEGEGSVTTVVEAAGDGWDLTVSLDDEWVEDREFPVVIDPTWEVWSNFTNNRYISDPARDEGFSWFNPGCGATAGTCRPFVRPTASSAIIRAGGVNSTSGMHHFQSYWDWDMWSGPADHVVPLRAGVDFAKFWVMPHGCLNSAATANGACANTASLRLIQMTQGWNPTPGTNDWSYSALSGAWNTSAPGYMDSTYAVKAGYWVGFEGGESSQLPADASDINRWVQGWVNDPATNHGFAVAAIPGSGGYSSTYGVSIKDSLSWRSAGSGCACGWGPTFSVFWHYVTPGAPQNLSAEVVDASAPGGGYPDDIFVDWDESVTGTWASHYNVELVNTQTGASVTNADRVVDLTAGDATEHRFEGLPPGSYQVRVSAVNGNATAGWNEGPVATADVTIGSAAVGLGLEPWWSYAGEAVGEQSDARVNVATGNLVVQAVDATPVQGHGDLAYVARRTYNSQDSTVVSFPGSIGAGWNLGLGAASDLTGVGLTPTGLQNGFWNAWSLAALNVELIDRDGTHHVFTPKGLSVGFDPDVDGELVSSALQALPLVGPGNPDLPAALAELVPTALELAAPFTNLCLDQSYQAPPGVELALFRYVAVISTDPTSANPCSLTNLNWNLGSWPTEVIGYSTMRPDRLFSQYDVVGRLVSMRDGAGNELRYAYEPGVAPVGGRLARVYEPRSCTDLDITGPVLVAAEVATTCRAFQFSYGTVDAKAVVWVLDPGGRRTGYYLGAGNPARLERVVDNDDKNPGLAGPGETQTVYTYGSCAGATAGQLCSITDTRGETTTFAYTAVGAGAPWVSALTDREGTTRTFTYDTANDRTVVDEGARRQTFAEIDTTGRVGLLAEGTATADLRRTRFWWDTYVPDGSTTSVPCGTAGPDNLLCRRTGEILDTAAGAVDTDSSAADDVLYTYNPESRVVREERRVAPTPALVAAGYPETTTAEVTTYGYRTQYAGTNRLTLFHLDFLDFDVTLQGTQVVEDRVTGSGTTSEVITGPLTALLPGVGGQPPEERAHASALYTVSDQIELLGPRGNDPANAATFADYRTTFTVQSNAERGPNAPPDGEVCTGGPETNTGLVCAVDAPGPDPSGRSVTRYTYDAFGQRITETSPQAIAETPAGSTPPATRYVYYPDTQADLSGRTSAGGWLAGIVDPAGHAVVFAYDQAGGVGRSWDRNATDAVLGAPFDPAQLGWEAAVTGFGTNPDTAPGGYHETLRACDPARNVTCARAEVVGTDAELFAAPWRWERLEATATGSTTTIEVDTAGNPARVRSPRGNAAGTADHDTVATFDAENRPLTVTTPAGATTTTYDPFGQPATRTGPSTERTVWAYDDVGRPTATHTARGPAEDPVPTGCTNAAGGDPNGFTPATLYCTATVAYDSVNNAVQSRDAAGATTTVVFDGAHRSRRQVMPRGTAEDATVIAETVFDLDGNPTSTCAPNHFATTTTVSVCDDTVIDATHQSYSPAGTVSSTTTYRGPGVPVVVTRGYDPDANLVAVTVPRGDVPGGITATAEFDLLGRLSSTTSPRSGTESNTTTYGYDPSGNRSSVTRPGGLVTSFSYDADHRALDTVEGATGPDAASELTAANATVAGGGANTRSRNVWDPDNNLVGVWGPNAFTTGSAAALTDPDAAYLSRTEFDTAGRAVATYSPRYSTALEPDDAIDAVQEADCPTGVTAPAVADASSALPGWPGGVGVCVSSATFDSSSRLGTVQPPSGDAAQATAYTWTADGLLAGVETADPADGAARVVAAGYHYDGAGRRDRAVDPAGRMTVTRYTGDGLVAEIEATANGPVTHRTGFAYDANGSRTTVTDPSGNDWVTTWTPDRLVATVAAPDPDGGSDPLVTTYEYWDTGQARRVWSPAASAGVAPAPSGAPSELSYTRDGLLATESVPVTDDGATVTARVTTHGYDPAGRQTSRTTDDTDPATGGPATVETYTHTANDRLAVESGRHPVGGPAGAARSYSYEPGGATTAVDDSGTGRRVESDWYLDGLVAGVDDGTHTTTYAYDGRGLTTGTDLADTGLVSRTLTDYNPAGLPATQSNTRAGGVWAWTYGSDRLAVSETRPDGAQLTSTWAPDATLAAQQLTGPAGTQNWAYTWDDQYRLVTNTGPGGTTAYAYDNAGRLDTVGGIDVDYDANNNRTTYGTDTWTYRADGAVATHNGGTPWAYTPWGGLTDDTCTTFTYSGFDEPATATTPTPCGGRSAGVTTQGHDPLGRLVTNTGPDTTETLTYHGLSDTTVAVGGDDAHTSILAPGGGPALAVDPDTGDPEFLTRDAAGALSLTTTATATTPTCTLALNPWGADTACQATGTTTTAAASLYRGQHHEPNLGTYRFGARTYNPTTATWLTPDTADPNSTPSDLSIGTDPLTANRYTYVNGDPINYTDPTGHYGKRAGSVTSKKRPADTEMRRSQQAAEDTAVDAGVANIDGVLDYLQNDELGQQYFMFIDACGQDNLDAADGNWSTQDVDCAATPGNLEALLRQSGETNPEAIEAAATQARIIGRIMQHTDRAWETIDDEVGWWDRHGGTVLAVVGGLACFGGPAACAVAFGVTTAIGRGGAIATAVRDQDWRALGQQAVGAAVDYAAYRLSGPAVGARVPTRQYPGVGSAVEGLYQESDLIATVVFRELRIAGVTTGNAVRYEQCGGGSGFAC